MVHDPMTYDECLRAAYLFPRGWTAFAIGLAIAAVLWRWRRRRTAIAVALLGAVIGVVDAYGFHEFNCVELWGLNGETEG